MSNLANLVKKGRKQFLLYQGFYYKKFKKISSKELWSCEEYQCPCKLETSTEGELKIVESITEHKHINENLSEISILNGFKPNYNDSGSKTVVESKYFSSSISTPVEEKDHEKLPGIKKQASLRKRKKSIEKVSSQKSFKNNVNENSISKNWKVQLDNIEKMRSNMDAPVDTMGCDQLFCLDSSQRDQRFQKLIALMLSSQTKDEITSKTMKRLFDIGCKSCNDFKETADEILLETIRPVSFYKTKVKHIKLVVDILLDKYEGDIPASVAELCKLPGVGKKMANLAMQCAWGKVTGIAVDTHVHRISNRLGWVETKAPEKTMVDLEDWLPRDYWGKVNHLMVGFGQQICHAVKPLCAECLNKDLCIYYSDNKNKKK